MLMHRIKISLAGLLFGFVVRLAQHSYSNGLSSEHQSVFGCGSSGKDADVSGWMKHFEGEAAAKNAEDVKDFEGQKEEEATESIDNDAKKVRLLCWFMTDPEILHKAEFVKNTWSKHCDVRLFISSETDDDFPTIGVNVSAGRNHIGAKSRAAWTLIYQKYRNQADFFMKADPDSYIAIDNLKAFLATRDTNDPEFYGHALYYGHTDWLGNFSGFYTAGQSVVLTKESLIRLASNGIDSKCFFDGQAEDLKTAVCLSKKKSYLIDTRDPLNRETFMPATGVLSVLDEYLPKWYTGSYRRFLGYCKSLECLSNFPIVFHYVTKEMYLIDLLVNSGKTQRLSFLEGARKAGFLKFNGSYLHLTYPQHF